jgi:hypothetical protein
MTQDEIDNWRTCANALFGAARIAHTPDNLLTETLRGMSHHHAIAALRVYREKPFKGFYLDRYLEHYREQAGTDAADADGRTDGQKAAAARLAAESEYWRQAAERAAADQRSERDQYEALPEEFRGEARQVFERLHLALGERALRILAIDMWNGRNPENWVGDDAKWLVKPERSRRDRDAEARAADREAWFTRMLNELGILRARLRELQMKHGEAVDVSA